MAETTARATLIPERFPGATLTPRQLVLLMLIESLWTEHGEPPSVRTLAQHYEVRSGNTVVQALAAMAHKGHLVLRQSDTSRGGRAVSRVLHSVSWPLWRVNLTIRDRKDAAATPRSKAADVRAPDPSWALYWVAEDWLGSSTWNRQWAIVKTECETIAGPPETPAAGADPSSELETEGLSQFELTGLAVLGAAGGAGMTLDALEEFANHPNVGPRLIESGFAAPHDEPGDVVITPKGKTLADALKSRVTPAVVGLALDRTEDDCAQAIEAARPTTPMPPATIRQPATWGITTPDRRKTTWAWRDAGHAQTVAVWAQYLLTQVAEYPFLPNLIDALTGPDPLGPDGDVRAPMTERSVMQCMDMLSRHGLVLTTGEQDGPMLEVTALGQVLIDQVDLQSIYGFEAEVAS